MVGSFVSTKKNESRLTPLVFRADSSKLEDDAEEILDHKKKMEAKNPG